MITIRWIRVSLIAGAVVLCGQAVTLAEDAAPPVQVLPQQIEVSSAVTPMDMRAEDADVLMEQIKTGSGQYAPEAQQAQVLSPSAGESRTIMVKPPEVVNSSPYFQFRDATERSKPDSSMRSMSERRATVDAYRQSLITERK
jgi:hypothetical protein